MSLHALAPYLTRPDPWAEATRDHWAHPHIAQQLLAAQLDPTPDLASRRPETIQCSVDWLFECLALEWGATVLDLGCGPGFYAQLLSERGLIVTGVDVSEVALEYAANAAQEAGLPIIFHRQDYRNLTSTIQYNAVLMTGGGLCAFNPADCATVLHNIHRVLKRGGLFAFDVSTRHWREKHGVRHTWQYANNGFWRPGPHLVLTQSFDYPEHSLWCDQFIIIEDGAGISFADSTITVYRNWYRDYDLPAISAVLAAAGFRVRASFNDLCGTPYTPDSEWIGIVAEKVRAES